MDANTPESNARPFRTAQYGSVAIIVPCYNESITIAKVVDDFRRVLPDATVYVYDNNSSDDTGAIAREHGAVVRCETRQGKGNVVRQMMRDIDADYYVMVDGDDTYPAEEAPKLLEPLFDNEADMVVGDRLSNGSYGEENDRAFHGFGNNLVRWLIKRMYGFEFTDVMTGYRAYNAVFAKTMPVLRGGFEIETELSIHAVDKRWRIAQVPIDYRDRPEGSESKLSTVSDGVKVLRTILSLFKDYRPLTLFGWLSLILIVVGLFVGVPVVCEFAHTGLVLRFPSAILAMGLVICGVLSMVCGLILDTVAKGARISYELHVIEAYGEWDRKHHLKA
jgi:glycosyltransferase involved in cell wall biosynthesis